MVVFPEEPLEKQLWKSADKLRKNIDAAEYKHVVLGLIFLKYISDAFEEHYDKLKAGVGEYEGADPEDKDEYKAENVFFVPAEARWNFLLSKAKQPTIGKTVDAAMDFIEKENTSLKGVLPKVYARQNLDPTSLGELIDMIGNIALGDVVERKLKDIVCNFISGFGFKSSDYTDNGIPLIKIGNIQNKIVMIDVAGTYVPNTIVNEKLVFVGLKYLMLLKKQDRMGGKVSPISKGIRFSSAVGLGYIVPSV